MKSLINRVLGLLALTFLSLLPAQAATLPTWAESYGVGSYDRNGKAVGDDPFTGSGTDVPRGIASMPDGGFVVAGQIPFPYVTLQSTNGPASDAVLVRFAGDGTILWQTELAQTNGTFTSGLYNYAPSYIARVRTDAQGNIFVAGTKGNPSSQGAGYAPFVAKFSPDGQLIWQNGIPEAGGTVPGTPPHSYTAGVNGSYLEMGLTQDGGVVITSTQGRPDSGYSIPIIAKFDANGSVSFYRAYENPDQYLPNGPVAQTADGSKYVTICGHQLPNDPNAPYGLFVFVTDTAGNVLAQRAFAGPGGGREYPLSLIRTSDGGFASLSAHDDFAGIVFRKFNADASAVTIEHLITPASNQQRFYVGSLSQPADTGSFSQTADGGFLIGGHCAKPASNSAEDAALMKLHADGTLEFFSLIGGAKAEGNFNGGLSGSVATPLSGGGYGIAISTSTYATDPAGADFRKKPDWWMVKTDASRKVRSFTGTMEDLPPGSFNVSPSAPNLPVAISYLTTPPYSAGPLPSTDPGFVLVDLAARTGVDRPSFVIQAGSPRIVSSRTTEAVVGQHFAYHTLAAFFDPAAHLTFGATNLPQGFIIDASTGVISGVAGAGTETSTPIAIALSVTDGVDTAQLTLLLTIGDGVPFLTVNGSDQPTPNLADTILTFATRYPGKRVGRYVSVQSATTPQGPWTDLDNGYLGYMARDLNSGRYVLGTTNYPAQNGVYFRSRAVTQGFNPSEVVSNVVGPFDLASGKPRAGKTVFQLLSNGLRENFDFRANEKDAAAGIAVRVQTTQTPSVESSWTDLTDIGGNNISAMNPDGEASHYALLAKKLPEGRGIYFRAIARSVSAGALVDAPSNFIGPKIIETVIPPHATITSPSNGTFDNPVVITTDASGVASIQIHATATAGPNRSLDAFALQFDGNVVYSVPGGTASASIDYTKNTNAIGDHVIEVLAVDDRRTIARAGTGPVYVRIVPPTPAASSRAGAAPSNPTQNQALGGKVYHVVNGHGYWRNPTTWQDSAGNNGVPGKNDFAIIGDAEILFEDDIGGPVVGSVSINGGTLYGYSGLDVAGTAFIAGATFKNGMSLFISEGGVLQLTNSANLVFQPNSAGNYGVLFNAGTINIHGAGGLTGVADFHNVGLVNFQLPLLPSIQAALGLPPGFRTISAQIVHDSGKVSVQSLVTDNGSGIVTNASSNLLSENGLGFVSPDGGSVISRDGAGVLSDNGIGVISRDGAGLLSENGLGIISTDGNSIISQDGASIISQDGGSVATRNGGLFKTGGNGGNAPISADGATATSGYVKQGGELDLNGITIIGPLSLESGVVTGSGVIAGNLINTGGYIAPGHSPGEMRILGNFTQNSGGSLILEAGGAEPGQFDQIKVTGTANLGGKLDLKTISGYVPFPNDPLNQLTASATSGSFDSISSNGAASVTGTGLITTTNPSTPNPAAGQPVNIATRMGVQTGDNVLIAGFIVTGPSGSTKKVMIRGLGPSLAPFGVPNTLPDPLLELHKSGGTTINDDWQQGDTSQIPNGFAPGDSHESVIVATLAPGSYSAVLKGAHGEAGVGIAEVYDLDPASAAKLGNLSTRGFINTGDDVMIGGFIVGGNEPARILVRAIGPTLSDFGVQGALQDPTLELHDGNGASISNDDWRESQEADIQATTLPPNKNQEPAILATLAPGSYTAVVRGKNNTTGIGLVEAFTLQ
jgi:hypothetical protein